jgi:hypothetical protein
MNLKLSAESLLLVDLRATGILRAVGHDPTMRARPEPATVIVAGGDGPVTVPIHVRFRAEAIEPPTDLAPSDRAKMLENLRSREVLDAGRHPTIDFRGRYEGTFERGDLAGDLRVRGANHAIAMSVRIEETEDGFVARGTWEGKLTTLGVKPVRALFGALKLEDWARMRLEARFVKAP